MSVNRAVMLFAGAMVLVSVLLTVTVSPWFTLFTVFIGANLIQASFTGFCPPAILLRKLGAK
jgi:Protein of unknown function (DUF2892)